jgi:hypothetical protein
MPFLLAAVLALSGAPGTSLDRAAGPLACSPGSHHTTYRGRKAVRFCGSASVVVHLGSRTVKLAGGQCQRLGATFSVNIGTIVPGLANGGPDYFGLTVSGFKPSQAKAAAIAVRRRGKGYAVVSSKVTVARGFHHGSFTGRLFPSKAKVSGSFTCC